MDKPLKKIPDQKLKAFSIGSMGNRQLSKRELEELKKKEQEQAAAQVFEEFVATFDNVPTSKVGKTWIKAGTYDAGRRHEDSKDKGKIYKPQSKFELEKSSTQRSEEYAKNLSRMDKPMKKKKEGEKKKTNLELFKEELKMIQEERDERHKYKGAIKTVIEDPEIIKGLGADELKLGSFDTGDPNTTNLYLGNLNPKITEQQLMDLFGKYGPLASIKIMWPRSDEEKARGRNCGFVAYMSRRDGERALRCLNGKDVMQYEMKLGWGKSVPIPPFPIYIPPRMLALTMPPPPSSLPFNAQPSLRDKHRIPKRRGKEELNPEDEERLNKVTYQAVVKVVVPLDRNILMLIHHMIEFVIREGPMFEAMIMNKEINNPMFSFLFDNHSPSHVYYRWKLFSMLQGDSPKEWRTEEFRMFKGGSVWRPPPMCPFANGMPDELFEDDIDMRKGTLSITQRERLEDLLRNMTPERMKIGEVMIFCVEHVDAADEICDCIIESLSNPNTLLYKKIARIYLVSDILQNCLNKMVNASYFRLAFESRLVKLFEGIHKQCESMENSAKAEVFQNRILHLFKAWSDASIYPKEMLTRLENIFLGLSSANINSDMADSELTISAEDTGFKTEAVYEDSELDGAPLSDNGDDIDGVPLDGAALLKAMKQSATVDDIDGVPLTEEDIDGVPIDDQSAKKSKTLDRSTAFVPSRWETVDPEEAEAQAMTTSKWELLEMQANSNKPPTVDMFEQDDNSQLSSNSNADNSLNEDDRRAKLREIELKVMQYQDELESGKRNLKPGATVSMQVEHYRKKLHRKIEKQKIEKKEKEREGQRRSSSYEEYPMSRRSKRSKSDSASPDYSKRLRRSRSRSGSQTPIYKSSSSAQKSVTSTRIRRVDSPSSRKRRISPSPPLPNHRVGGRYRGESPASVALSPSRVRKGRRSNSYSPSRYSRRGYTPPSPTSHKKYKPDRYKR